MGASLSEPSGGENLFLLTNAQISQCIMKSNHLRTTEMHELD